MEHHKQRVLYFLIILTVLTIIAHYAASFFDSKSIISLIIMWSPGLTAIIVGLATRRPFRDIGWTIRPVKWLAAGWLLPIVYAGTAYGAIWLLNLGDVPNPVFLERARLTLSMPDQPEWLLITAAFGYITLVNLLPSMILALGEEIGWRGFLVPELTRWIGFRKAALISGVIWGAWHLPGILSGKYAGTGTPIAYQLFCFSLLVLSSGVIFAWLRLKSGSIWTVAILHATHNGVIQAFFNRITVDTGSTNYFIGEFGIAMVPGVIALGWYCLKHPISLEGSTIVSE
ncbi:MAG: CPBP family intramembrane glutamic endopeptidase [Bacteroidota bacterium]